MAGALLSLPLPPYMLSHSESLPYSLYVFCVNQIILCMRPDKSYQDCLYGKFDNRYQSVVISPDIEHITLIADAVYTVEHLFHICKTIPFGLPHFLEPVFQCRSRIRMQRIVFNNSASCNNAHVFIDFMQSYIFIPNFKILF